MEKFVATGNSLDFSNKREVVPTKIDEDFDRDEEDSMYSHAQNINGVQQIDTNFRPQEKDDATPLLQSPQAPKQIQEIQQTTPNGPITCESPRGIPPQDGPLFSDPPKETEIENQSSLKTRTKLLASTLGKTQTQSSNMLSYKFSKDVCFGTLNDKLGEEDKEEDDQISCENKANND